MSNYNFITLPQWICSSFFATYADFDGPRFTDTRLIRTPYLLRTLCFFPREKSPFIFSQQAISEFPQSLCIKTRLSAQPLIWKWFFILMQIKLIFTRSCTWPHFESEGFWNSEEAYSTRLIHTDTFCGPLSVRINGVWLYLCRYWWVPVSRCLWSQFCL